MIILPRQASSLYLFLALIGICWERSWWDTARWRVMVIWGDWPLSKADHPSSWSRAIMTHTSTFHKKGDFNLLTADRICHFLGDDYSEGYKVKGSPPIPTFFLWDKIVKKSNMKFSSKVKILYWGSVTIDMRYAYCSRITFPSLVKSWRRQGFTLPYRRLNLDVRIEPKLVKS